MFRAGHKEFLSPAETSPFWLNEWFVQPAIYRMSTLDETIQLEPRVMHVLTCLASCPGDVVSREALLGTVWADSLVCEDSLTRAISDLRRACHDDPRCPRIIETIRKRGYRLIAVINSEAGLAHQFEYKQREKTEATATMVQPLPEKINKMACREQLFQSARFRSLKSQRPIQPYISWRLLLPLVGLFLFVCAIDLISTPGDDHPLLTRAINGCPLTSSQGLERQPAISPDGTRVAFVMAADDGTGRNIYLTQNNAGSYLTLTVLDGDEVNPAWSPDGTRIAFISLGQSPGIYTVPSIGGELKLLLAGPDHSTGLAWSPDGKFLAFATKNEEEAFRIHLFDLATSEVRTLSSPPSNYHGDSSPTFSPDSKQIAFIRSDNALIDDIYQISISGEETMRLTTAQEQVAGLAWTPDGEHLIFSAAPDGNWCLWRYTKSSGAVSWLPTPGDWAMSPTISVTGQQLVYEQILVRLDIGRLNLSSREAISIEQTTMISSTRNDYAASYSPGGERIAFISNRSGYEEIWLCESDGAKPRQLTQFQGSIVLEPHWSADGEAIIFSAFTDDQFAIFKIDIIGGMARRVLNTDCHEIVCFCSKGGEWIWFKEDSEKGWQYKKMSTDDGRIEVVANENISCPVQSVDGDYIYYQGEADGYIWRQSTSGGEKELVSEDEIAVNPWHQYAPTARGLFYTKDVDSVRVLSFIDFETGTIDSLYEFNDYSGGRLALSPDGEYIAFDRAKVQSDLILQSDFY